MKNSFGNSFIGWLCIFAGLAIIVVAAGKLILQLLCVAGGLILIKQGLQLNAISIVRLATQLWFKRRF